MDGMECMYIKFACSWPFLAPFVLCHPPHFSSLRLVGHVWICAC